MHYRLRTIALLHARRYKWTHASYRRDTECTYYTFSFFVENTEFGTVPVAKFARYVITLQGNVSCLDIFGKVGTETMWIFYGLI